MAQLSPYLAFEGNCRQAMKFYKEVFGGELELSTFGNSPMETKAEDSDKIMHAQLVSGDMVIMGSDGMSSGGQATDGRVTLSVNCSSLDEQERLFNKLGEGGKVTMPLEDTFWGARFGMLTDMFGIKWMFNCDKK